MTQPAGLENLLMNGRRFIVHCWLVLVVLLLGPAGLSFAAAPTLPENIRLAIDPGVVKQPVQTFLDAQFPKLTDADPAVQAQGREAIIAEVQTTGAGATQKVPSPSFLNAYAEAVNAGLTPLAKNDDVRIRLNAAIIAKRVAERAGNDRLMPVVITLLGDQSEGVAIWAVKACKFILPAALSNRAVNAEPLTKAFIDAVQKYPKSSAIIQSAYDALRVDQGPGNTWLVPPAAVPQVIPAYVGLMQTLAEFRATVYRDMAPVSPSVESGVANFLTLTDVWKVESTQPALVLRTVQVLSDLISLASQRLGTAGSSDKTEYTTTISYCAQALTVVGDHLNTPAPRNALARLTRLGPSASASDVATIAAGLYPAISAVPQFAGLKPPPTVTAASSDSGSSTAPSTSSSPAAP